MCGGVAISAENWALKNGVADRTVKSILAYMQMFGCRAQRDRSLWAFVARILGYDYLLTGHFYHESSDDEWNITMKYENTL